MIEGVVMLDRVVLKLERDCVAIDFGLRIDFQAYGISFEPDDRFGPLGKIQRYSGFYKNMIIRVYRYFIIIEGSLSTLYNDHNCIDLSIIELSHSLNEIASVFNCRLKDLFVLSLEFGFSIPLNFGSVSDILCRMVRYVAMEPVRSKNSGKYLMNKFPLTDYTLICYDKTKESLNKRGIKLKGEVLRTEMKLSRKKLYQVLQNFLPMDKMLRANHLLNRKVLEKLMKEYTRQLKCIFISPKIDLEKLSEKDKAKYFQGTSIQYWELKKLTNYDSAKKELARFKKWLVLNGNSDDWTDYLNRACKKFELLLEDNPCEQYQSLIVVGKWGQALNEKLKYSSSYLEMLYQEND